MFISACTANDKSIYRYKSLDGGQSGFALVDAKQRAILTSKDLLDEEGNPDPSRIRIFCSEPSPDVFAVIAQAFSGSGNFGKSGNPASVEAALKATFNSAESGATIPRTQSISLLREQMFRTCERYLSGGIDQLELSIQAIRDQRLIVSILAIEQLTGVVTPKPVIINNSSSGTAGVNNSSIAELGRAETARDNAQKAVTAAKGELDKLNKPDNPKSCDKLDALGDSLPAADKPAKDKCDAARAALGTAEKNQSQKNDHYNTIRKAVETGGVTVAITSESSTGSGGGDPCGRKCGTKEIVEAVNQIVAYNYSQDEFLFLCLRRFNDPKIAAAFEKFDGGEIGKLCVKYIAAGINKAAEDQYDIEIIARRAREISQNTQRQFDLFEERLNQISGLETGQEPAACILPGNISLENQAPTTRSNLETLCNAQTQEERRRAFFALPDRLRRSLAGE